MGNTPVFTGEERYVSVFKGDRFVQRALCNLFYVNESLYTIHYHGFLNGHTILDVKIPRTEQPNHIINEPINYLV